MDIFNQDELIQSLMQKFRDNKKLKLLGLDIGRKKIGIALWTMTISTPLKVLKRMSTEDDVISINRIADEFSVQDLIIGVPIHNDIIPKSANYIIDVAKKLNDHKTVYFQDESFSSCEAIESLKKLDITRKKRDQIDDAVAACVILDSFITTFKIL